MDPTTAGDHKVQEPGEDNVISELRQGSLDANLSAAQSRRVLLKIDAVVMPLIVIAMTLAFLDKVRLPEAY